MTTIPTITEAQIKASIFKGLKKIAPEADLDSLGAHRRNATMAEPTIEMLLDVMHDELARLREKAIAINLVSADLLSRGYSVYRQEMPDELYHLLAIKDDDETIYRFRVLTQPPVRGMDDLLPGELIAVVIDGTITYHGLLDVQ